MLDACVFPIKPPGVGFSIMWVILVVNFLMSMGTFVFQMASHCFDLPEKIHMKCSIWFQSLYLKS